MHQLSKAAVLWGDAIGMLYFSEMSVIKYESRKIFPINHANKSMKWPCALIPFHSIFAMDICYFHLKKN